MGALDSLLDQVKQAITKHSTGGQFDAGSLIGHITDLFGKHPQNNPGNPGNVKPASQDPYGDPGVTGR